MQLRRFALAALIAAAVTPASGQEMTPAPEQTTPADPATPSDTPTQAAPPPEGAEHEAASTPVPLSAPTQEPIAEDTDAPEVAATGPSRIVALSAQDEAAYRAAFEAIERGNWRGVNQALTRVEDNALVATVRGRMLATRAFGARFADLNAWLARYGELGVSQAVYQRARDVRPHRGRGRRRRAVGPPPISPDAIPTRNLPGYVGPPAGDTAAARVAIVRITERVAAGDDEGARSLAIGALDGPRSGQAQWELGLVAYRAHDYAEAVRQFEGSTQWPYHGGWAKAAVHYWAARARLAAGEPNGVKLHLESAAARPWTFYGQLAESQLGRDSALTFTPPAMDEPAIRRFIERYPAARRAAALAQLGRLSEVESEMRRLHGSLQPNEDATYLALAVALQAPSAQLRAAEYGGPELAYGFCPANSFQPMDGFTLDRALVYAIVRQESYFNPRAVSVSNARGLMQLLPSTARDMDRSTNYRRNPTGLFDPGLNLKLGQSYVQWLFTEFHSDRDLGRVFAAYNGGPSWLSRWLATVNDTSDPLMILETLPRAESRDYAERVLSHMALCRKSFGQPTPELDRLASGQAAAYTPLDTRAVANSNWRAAGGSSSNGASSQ